jgi:hypothetical protein
MFESLAVAYRATVFGISGYSEFSKHGFIKNSAKFTPNALDVDLTGKVNLSFAFDPVFSFALQSYNWIK